MSSAEDIMERMAAVRARGLRNARELGHDFERLSDWREHVRAHPIPLTLAALAAGFYIVPTKPKQTPAAVASQMRAAASGPVSRAAEPVGATSTPGMKGAVLGFVGSMLANTIRGYVSHQIQTLLSGGEHDQAPSQRKAPHRSRI
jgi:hypothetical protein